MSFEKHSENKWIVKSDSKILGPYSFDQIEDLIQKKQISLIDEIRDTETRWLYVRENPEFSKIVETIRKELDSKLEGTKTFQTISKTTEAHTKTEIPQFTNIDNEVQDVSVIKEIIQNQIKEKSAIFDEAPRKEKVKLYGFQNDQAIKNKIEASNKRSVVLVISLFVLIVAGFFGFNFYQRYSQQKQEEQYALQIKKYKFLGLEQKAVEVYEQLQSDNQKKLLPEVIELLPLLETKGLMQIQDIENLKNASDLSLDQKTNVQLVLFWSAMQAQNFGLAQEYIVKAHTLQPASKLIKENEALIEIKKNNFTKAFELYNDLFKADSSGRYLFGLAQAIMGLNSAERQAALPLLSQQIENYTMVRYDFKKELLLAQMVFAKWLKNENLFQASWKQFVQTPCGLSRLFKKPLLLSPQSYQWKDLSEYVSTLHSFLNPEESVIFNVHNQLESGAITSADQYLKNNSTRIKENHFRQQLSLLVFYAQGRSADIVALEKTNQLDDQSEVNHLLVALSQIDLNPQAKIDNHLQFFKQSRLDFYADWLLLAQLIKNQSTEQLRIFTKNHFVTVSNFLPLLEGKSMVE